MKKIAAFLIATILSSGALLWDTKTDGLLHVYFLNIGQGDATLIRTPKGHTILVDGGPGTTVLTELQEVLGFFEKRIDYVVMTHPDRDHSEGLLAVLDRYDVGAVFVSGMRPNDWLSQGVLKRIGPRTRLIFADQTKDIRFEDEVQVDTLYPFNQMLSAQEGDTNNASIVMKISFGTEDILMTGDLEEEGEMNLIKAGVPLDSEILKVGHHGSAGSSSSEFIKAVSPDIGVISAGKGNTYGHPHEKTLTRLAQRGVKVLRTDRDGRIELVFSKDALVSVSATRTISAPSKRSFSSKRS